MSNAIPTMYNGIRFRSRLEAQWAAFFDLLGWAWQYEPFDLAGYIPDFALSFVSGTGRQYQTLVEVKPEMSLHGLTKHKAKIEKSGWTGDVIIVGVSPFEKEFGDLAMGIGGLWIPPGTFPGAAGGFDWSDDGASFFKCALCSRVAVCAWGGPACGLCGGMDDGPSPPIDLGLIRSLWMTAKNRVQWRGGFGS